jgi:hypothetical protein
MIKKPEILVGEIDYKAGKTIESGNTDLATKDRKYRSNIEKELDYGMDL